jgi:hypothetical protein
MRTDGVGGSRDTGDTEDRDVRGQGTVRAWTRNLLAASGGGPPSRAALHANAVSLDADEIRSMATLTDAEVRESIAGALGPEHAASVGEVGRSLRDAVGNALRAQVRDGALAALRTRQGELRSAMCDDAKMARVLDRIAGDPSPVSRETTLSALGAPDPRAAAALLRRGDVQTSLANGRLPPQTAALVAAMRSPQQAARNREMFDSAIGAAGRDPFAFALATDRVSDAVGARPGGFVDGAFDRARDADAADRSLEHAAAIGSGAASTFFGGGVIGSSAFGLAEVSVAQGRAGAQLAGHVAGISSTADAREAAADATAAIAGAGAGVVAGRIAGALVPHTWLGRLIETVGELGSNQGANHGTRRLVRE